MFSSDRNELRNVFFEAWRKYQNKLPLEPLEAELIDIILLHPEYQEILNHPENRDIEFTETNPFLHLSLHLALLEQIKTNRPAGIEQIYLSLCQKKQDAHLAAHLLMECLAEIIWEAHNTGEMPSEEVYLNRLKRLLD